MRNGDKLYYPVTESIKSILPVCDEFIIAVGRGDDDDNTRKLISDIKDTKIKIIETVWDEKYFKNGKINAIQTDIAMKACSGDWLFYIQADEVVHEKYLPVIKNRCHELLDRREVEGLLFGYKHFWGDYNHYHTSHGWYPYEIRIIRNLPTIHSYKDAQSFRHFDHYDNPHQNETRKLKVAKVNAQIYHYGWVRPPYLMKRKNRVFSSFYRKPKNTENYLNESLHFDYGPLNRLAVFKESHPEVMTDRIRKMNWSDKLQYSEKPSSTRKLHKHERLKYRFVSFVEKMLKKPVGDFKNYILLKNI